MQRALTMTLTGPLAAVLLAIALLMTGSGLPSAAEPWEEKLVQSGWTKLPNLASYGDSTLYSDHGFMLYLAPGGRSFTFLSRKGAIGIVATLESEQDGVLCFKGDSFPSGRGCRTFWRKDDRLMGVESPTGLPVAVFSVVKGNVEKL